MTTNVPSTAADLGGHLKKEREIIMETLLFCINQSFAPVVLMVMNSVIKNTILMSLGIKKHKCLLVLMLNFKDTAVQSVLLTKKGRNLDYENKTKESKSMLNI